MEHMPSSEDGLVLRLGGTPDVATEPRAPYDACRPRPFPFDLLERESPPGLALPPRVVLGGRQAVKLGRAELREARWLLWAAECAVLRLSPTAGSLLDLDP